MRPDELPQTRPLRPVQGRYGKVVRKWTRIADEKRWDMDDQPK